MCLSVCLCACNSVCEVFVCVRFVSLCVNACVCWACSGLVVVFTSLDTNTQTNTHTHAHTHTHTNTHKHIHTHTHTHTYTHIYIYTHTYWYRPSTVDFFFLQEFYPNRGHSEFSRITMVWGELASILRKGRNFPNFQC